MKKNKQRRGEKTKKHILDTALHLFSLKGYDHVTVEEIVKVSGTSKGSFYAHFHSKYEIFLEKFKEIDLFYLSFSQTLSSELGSTDKILAFVNAQMDFIQYELGKDIMRVIYVNALTANPHNYFLDQSRPMYNILRTFVEEGWLKKELNEDIAMDEILMILSRCMRGSIYDWCMSNEDYSLAQESNKLFSVVVKGLRV